MAPVAWEPWSCPGTAATSQWGLDEGPQHGNEKREKAPEPHRSLGTSVARHGGCRAWGFPAPTGPRPLHLNAAPTSL